MKTLSRLLAAALLATTAAALDLKVVEATINGVSRDPSSIRIVPQPPHSRGTGQTLGGHADTSHSKTHVFSKKPRMSAKRSNPIRYSGGWCGASQKGPRTNKFTGMSSMFQAPELTARPNVPLPQYAAAWIGIDGNSCSGTLLQAGVTTTKTSTAHTSSAWLEWIPNAAYGIPDFPVSPGDWMNINITVTSSTSATMVIENYSLSNTITVNLNNGYTLCQADASWIIEDFYVNNQQVPFGDFGELWFLYTEARRQTSGPLGIDNAEFIFMQNGWVIPSCTAEYYDNENFYAVSGHNT